MRPNRKFNFGKDAACISVIFHDGASLVFGYVVKQMSAISYIVSTTDDSLLKRCRLAQTTEDIDLLIDGIGEGDRLDLCAFNSANGYVKKVESKSVYTIDGARVSTSILVRDPLNVSVSQDLLVRIDAVTTVAVPLTIDGSQIASSIRIDSNTMVPLT